MSKRPRAVYEPGELDRVRQKIGPLDPREAKRMAELLGGEVGIERSDEDPQLTSGRKNHPPTALWEEYFAAVWRLRFLHGQTCADDPSGAFALLPGGKECSLCPNCCWKRRIS